MPILQPLFSCGSVRRFRKFGAKFLKALRRTLEQLHQLAAERISPRLRQIPARWRIDTLPEQRREGDPQKDLHFNSRRPRSFSPAGTWQEEYWLPRSRTTISSPLWIWIRVIASGVGQTFSSSSGVRSYSHRREALSVLCRVIQHAVLGSFFFSPDLRKVLLAFGMTIPAGRVSARGQLPENRNPAFSSSARNLPIAFGPMPCSDRILASLLWANFSRLVKPAPRSARRAGAASLAMNPSANSFVTGTPNTR